MENDNGWHKYPPSEKFKQDDDVGISGTKTFELVLSANERKDKLPPLIFSYFDPVKETLRHAEKRSDSVDHRRRRRASGYAGCGTSRSSRAERRLHPPRLRQRKTKIFCIN